MKKSLLDLHPHWFYRNGQIEGVRFHCPICPIQDKPSRHSIQITWIAPSVHESGCVWTKTSGNTFDTLSVQPSIDCTISKICKFHGFITNGMVEY